MPLYDFVMLAKPQLERRSMVELLARLGKRVYSKQGVITNVKSFGRVGLAYGIKKRDGRYREAQMMQMTMMVSPSIVEELSYLNKEERLLRWILVKSRGVEWSKGNGPRNLSI